KNYLYEIVPLSLFTFRNYNSDKSILQYKDIITQSVVAKQPFAIDNGETVHFTGTYSWVAPEYSTVIGDDGFKKITIARDGYWKKDYITEKNAFKVSSYNYYEKDKISAINVTYQYIPNSYVVTAEISHPAIAYECLLGEVREEIKYSYLLNGFEYDYYNSNAISYDNGTYWGQIQLLDINDSYVNTKVKLYKKNTIVNSTYVEKIEVQPAYVSYEYYTYKEATPLCNEKIPVLYKTELIPAKKKKVQYWDKSTNSYAIKSVLASYAYFSYSYTYETVPFQVASYIYSDGLNISNFPVLGGYISNIGESISSEMKVQSNAVKQLTYDLTQLVSYNIVQERNIANEEIVTFSTYQTVIDNTLKEFDKNTSTSLSNMSSGLNEKITTLTNKEEAAINKLEEGVVAEIIEQHNIIKDSLNDVKNTINDRLESFEEVYHADTIGEAAKEEKESKWESITYTPIIEKRSGLISGYSYSKQSGSQTITIGGDSIGEILQTTLGCVSTYTVTKYNDNGSYTVTTYEGFNGLANILANLSINKKLPDYKEFMVDLVPKMFASVDFEGDYNIVYDVNGNVKSKEKRNPTDIAKKCIMRADILWEELKKKNIVS
ncbi:MAG: hypothetical protein IJH39_07310, partial [Clostridia bacterium]|nr:hypothetical protein [Clostridia bacterium]